MTPAFFITRDDECSTPSQAAEKLKSKSLVGLKGLLVRRESGTPVSLCAELAYFAPTGA
jgi:hypothetical protein